MVRKRLLLLLKPFDPCASHELHGLCPSNQRKDVVHKNAINFCRRIVKKKVIKSKVALRSDLSQPIHDVDLVISIGGDGTLLHASHFMDDSIPVLEVNSDPTRPQEVEEFSEEYDATRSTGYLCAATVNNFEQILDGILENHSKPSELVRMAVSVNSK